MYYVTGKYVLHDFVSEANLLFFKGGLCILHLNNVLRSQLKILQAMVDASWYVTNQMLHPDLRIPFIADVIEERRTL